MMGDFDAYLLNKADEAMGGHLIECPDCGHLNDPKCEECEECGLDRYANMLPFDE